jgi:hypothetical protein
LDCETDPVQIELVESTDTDCGASNGSFVVNASGGEGPYTFSTKSSNNTDGEFTNANAGNYKVTATDAVGCSAVLNVAIKNLDGVNVQNVVANNAGCGTKTGSIQITATGGEGPYLFSINGGATQANNEFTGLAPGNYLVGVADQLGCEITKSTLILSGISFKNSISDIIKNDCAVSGCHNGTRFPDLRTLSSIQSNAASIKSKTANKSMPKGSSLSQDQIDKIACWVNDGALDN